MPENKDKILEEILAEAGNVLGDDAKDAKDELLEWGKILTEIRIARITADEEELPILKKDEEYAWNAVSSIGARYKDKFEKDAWKVVENILVILRKVILG